MQFHIPHFSAFSRRIFHPRPQEGVFRCDFNKIYIHLEEKKGRAKLTLPFLFISIVNLQSTLPTLTVDK
jgi:hypothetical protein